MLQLTKNFFFKPSEPPLVMDLTHLLDVFKGYFLVLSSCHGEDIHLQSSQSQCGIVLQLRAKPFQHHIITTLEKRTGGTF